MSVETLLALAATELGVQESPPGSNRGPRVEQYQKLAGSVPGAAWCGSFVVWCFRKAGLPLLGRDTWQLNAARAWFTKGRRISANEARPGDVFGVKFGLHGEIRHVGLVVSVTSERIVTIEGNSNTNGSREGTAVISKTRHKAGLVFARWIQIPENSNEKDASSSKTVLTNSLESAG